MGLLPDSVGATDPEHHEPHHGHVGGDELGVARPDDARATPADPSTAAGEADHDRVALGVRPDALSSGPASSDDVVAFVGNLFAQAQSDLVRDPSLRLTDDGPITADGVPIADGAPGTKTGEAAGGGPNQLTDEEQAVVNELQARDQQVRAHERAHAAAGGGLAGAPTFTYQTGPDGRRYAVGGEVQIRTGGGGTPEERLRQAQRVQAAALAPADPSGQDRAVAAAAAADAAAARAELAASSGAVEGDDDTHVDHGAASASTEHGRSRYEHSVSTAVDATSAAQITNAAVVGALFA